MRRLVRILGAGLGVLGLAACGGPGPGPGSDGGTDPDGGAQVPSRYHLHTLTPAADQNDLTLSVGPGGRLGLAWFDTLGPQSGRSGVIDYQLRYAEWRDGALGTVEDVRVVQHVFGVDLAYDGDGRPQLTYLGGNSLTDTGGTSAFWNQSDAVVTRRRQNGSWEEEIVARFSADAPAPPDNDVSNTGFLLGLYPAIAFHGGQTFLAWRDSHNGQFQQQDWAGSDLEFAVGTEGSWALELVLPGGKDKQGYGGHNQLVVADGRPAIVSDRILGAPGAIGSDVVFSRKRVDGTWNAHVRPFSRPIGNTGTGPSLAHDEVLGFAVAVVDRSDDSLWFTRSVNDGATWSDPDPVFHAGSGGWYPSLSVNPQTHDPSIAFFVCARAAGVQAGSCPERDDELVVTERIGGIWREHRVDEAGAFRPKLRHLADGRRAVAYRDPRSGALKLAVEK